MNIEYSIGFDIRQPGDCLYDIKNCLLTLIKGALEENLQLLFKMILHHDALS